MNGKKYILPVAAIAAIVGLTGCTSVDDEGAVQVDRVAARITGGLSAENSRAVNGSWNHDKIGVMVIDAPNSEMEAMYRNVEYITTSTGATADFNSVVGNGICFQDIKETVTFAAYAPYQASSSTEALPGNGGVIEVETSVNNKASLQESIDFVYASGATASFTKPEVQFQNLGEGRDYSFHHVMSKIVVNIMTSVDDGFEAGDAEYVEDVVLKGLVHKGTFDVTTGVAAVATAAVAEDVSMGDWVSGYTTSTNTKTYQGIVLPQEVTSGMEFEVNLGGKKYSVDGMTAKFEPGKSYIFNILVKKNEQI